MCRPLKLPMGGGQTSGNLNRKWGGYTGLDPEPLTLIPC